MTKLVKINNFDLRLQPLPLTLTLDILQAKSTKLVEVLSFCFVKINEELTEL